MGFLTVPKYYCEFENENYLHEIFKEIAMKLEKSYWIITIKRIKIQNKYQRFKLNIKIGKWNGKKIYPFKTNIMNYYYLLYLL